MGLIWVIINTCIYTFCICYRETDCSLDQGTHTPIPAGQLKKRAGGGGGRGGRRGRGRGGRGGGSKYICVCALP